MPVRQVAEQAVLQRHALVCRFPRPCPPDQATLFQWAGGFPALLRLTRRFYEVHVPEDPLLSGLFSQMSPDHPQRVASWLGQVFGGPPAYSERYGEYDRMISQHLDKALKPEQRARWVQLLTRSADEVGLPADAEFRAAFTAYLEWGSRIALENSTARRSPATAHAGPSLVVGVRRLPVVAQPRQRYAFRRAAAAGCCPPPTSRSPSRPTSSRCSASATATRCASRSTSGPHDDVAAHADAILERLRAGTMPCDGAWPPERIDVFERWIAAGTRA